MATTLSDITVSNEHGALIVAHACNLNETAWSFTASDTNGRRLEYSLHLAMPRLAAMKHAQYLAQEVGDPTTYNTRKQTARRAVARYYGDAG